MKLRNSRGSLALILTGILFLTNCGGGGAGDNRNANAVVTNANNQNVNLPALNNNAAEIQNAKPDNASAQSSGNQKSEKPGTAASSKGETGVPECDEYIAKYEVCLNKKIPQAQQILLKPRFEQQRENFKQLAKMPDGKKDLAETCRMIAGAVKGATAQYGCEW